jgi:putative flippase GtrA
MSFTAVGLTGLAVDAGLFALLTHGFLWRIALARTASVCAAILTTWVLNRAVTFAEHRSPRRGAEFVRYAAAQSAGLAVNIGTFTLFLWLVPALRQAPLAPLFVGCAGGFAFNFTVMRTLVFPRAPVLARDET